MIVDLLDQLDLEGLQDQAAIILAEEVNEEIASIDGQRVEADNALYTVLGLVTTLPMACEPIVEFHPGHRPSLIDAPIEHYPNLSVMAYQAQPRTSSDDQGTWYGVTVSVEVMVKAVGSDDEDRFTRENQAAEELVNRRVQRTARAVHNVMLRDRSLGGFLIGSGLGDTPTRTIGDAFARREKDGSGARWLWQGARMDFTIDKYVGD
jgi:hypothetical protein